MAEQPEAKPNPRILLLAKMVATEARTESLASVRNRQARDDVWATLRPDDKSHYKEVAAIMWRSLFHGGTSQ